MVSFFFLAFTFGLEIGELFYIAAVSEISHWIQLTLTAP